MKEFQVAYIPVGVPTFHLESAGKLFEESADLLRGFCENVKVPSEMLLSIDKLKAFLEEIDPDLIVLQNVTFANAAYASEVMHYFSNVPLLLWTLREPVIDGGRLRLNSLTGAYSAAGAIKAFKKEPFEYIFGAPSEKKVEEKISETVRAAKLLFDMRNLKIAAIGHTPQGFGFGRALDLELLETFGVHLESIEARELIDKAKSYSDEECLPFLEDAKKRMVGLNKTTEKNAKDFARLYKAYKEYVTENNIGALASRCWPDFFTSFGTPVCAVLAMLNDLGIASSCEADTYGALSMYLGMQLTKSATFFGDPVSLDEKDNTISFWHCGTAACSLAREDTGAVVGEHCNRHIGPTLEFGCKPSEKVTIFRIGRTPEGAFRFFLATGEALDKPKQFLGTSLVVKTDSLAEKIIYSTVEGGWEPHYVVIYGDVATELEILAHMLNISIERY
ncbi:MAG: fucose isomerase [Butyrivibrio sp.]|nr:fucose isomerase [Butyrivibrio sp.]